MTILNNILAVSWHEFRVMCTRYSILLVLSGGIFVYGLLYNYMYAPNVVRDAPVAVVDMSRTPLSRSYIRLLDATPQARVLTNNADLPAAKELMKYDEVVGIVYIPADFDARVCVCVCGKTASCASLQVSPLHHLIKGAEKTKETTRE